MLTRLHCVFGRTLSTSPNLFHTHRKTVFKQECDLGQKLWQSDLLENHFQDDALLFALGFQVPRMQGTEGNNNASTYSIEKKKSKLCLE